MSNKDWFLKDLEAQNVSLRKAVNHWKNDVCGDLEAQLQEARDDLRDMVKILDAQAQDLSDFVVTLAIWKREIKQKYGWET